VFVGERVQKTGTKEDRERRKDASGEEGERNCPSFFPKGKRVESFLLHFKYYFRVINTAQHPSFDRKSVLEAHEKKKK
jgi:hypothetical protein